ncbi:MAG: hypothetical protein HYY01_08305 [Chloroflexi bacterium]|nr:hypothetical protein [Chloroflexota bacterium]
MTVGDRPVLSESDLRFVVETVATQRSDHDQIVQLLQDKPDLVDAMLDDDKLLRRVTSDQDVLLRVSPRLLFDILVRASVRELEKRPYTLERIGVEERIPVFDSHEVVGLMKDRQLRDYLPDMLASFTKTQSTTVYFKARHGYRRRSYSDMDLDDMVQLSELAEAEVRFPFYKRIGDICLFITGIFPEHVSVQHPVQLSARPAVAGRRPRALEEYEEYARRFYHLAAQHVSSETAGLEAILLTLAENFSLARKPLNYMSEKYIKVHKAQLFTQSNPL